MRIKTIFIIFAILISGCDGHDSDYFPYTMKGLDVWVHNNNTDMEYYVGRVNANYISKNEALSKCHNYAFLMASQHNFNDWSYDCRTITSSSSFAAIVR